MHHLAAARVVFCFVMTCCHLTLVKCGSLDKALVTTDLRLTWWLVIDFDSVLGLHCVVGDFTDVSEVRAASVFLRMEAACTS
jgi:hypothetical protein